MPTNDRLFDLQSAPDHRFLVYSFANSYVVPYSTDTHGGELITEFNQRAALNALLRREVDSSVYATTVAAFVDDAFGSDVEVDTTTGATAKQGPGLYSFANSELYDKANWKFISYATGVRSDSDFSLAVVGSSISVSAGTALVLGYFIQVDSEILIDTADVITPAEVADVMNNPGQNPNSPCRTKFIKLAIQYTAPENSRHDERLIPPLSGVYQGVCIVINDDLPSENELILGTVTRDANGRFVVLNNPDKTRIVPLDGIQGAENYSELLSAPEDEHIYGIKFGETGGSTEGEATNLIDIDKWLWIAFDSNLGKLLRSMSTNADTAGNSTDEPTRGIIVSDEIPYTGDDAVVDDFNCLHRVDAHTGNQFARMSWHQAQTPPRTGADLIDHRALYFQYAKAQRDGSPLIHREEHTPASDASIKKPFYDITEYPGLNGLNGTDGIMTYQQLAMLELVYSDYVKRERFSLDTGESPIGRMFGPFLSLDTARDWFERFKPTVRVGDYFWVINDTAEAGGTEATLSAETSEYELQNIVTNYGTVTGTATGTVKQSKLEVAVTGTGSGTAHKVDDPSSDEYEFDDIDIAGTAQGTVQATVKGTVTGTLTSFTQNVSGRYVCRYRGTGAGESWWKFAHGIMLVDNPQTEGLNAYQILDASGQSQSFQDTSDHKQNVLFALESIERGFAVPATANMFGVVKTGTGSQMADVIVDPTTQRLRITDLLLNLITGGGFAEYPYEEIAISPNLDLSVYAYRRYANGVVFKMEGNASDWRTALESTGTLAHLRGKVTLDFSEVIEDGQSTDGFLLRLVDIDQITLKGDNTSTSTHPSTETLLFSLDHCVSDKYFFTNIGKWTYSQFISGGNTLELDLPWMLVSDVFTNTVENSLMCKFASVTMGESGISSAMLDVWVKHKGWEDYNGGIDRMWASAGYIKFPPLFFEYNTDEAGALLSSINLSTIQNIPANLNLKISGTSGVHQAWDDNNSEYVPSGNLLVNMNWEYNGNPTSASTPGGKVYLNLYMKNSSVDVMKQNFSNLRFRTPVQVIRLDDNSMSSFVPYNQLYGNIVTRL